MLSSGSSRLTAALRAARPRECPPRRWRRPAGPATPGAIARAPAWLRAPRGPSTFGLALDLRLDNVLEPVAFRSVKLAQLGSGLVEPALHLRSPASSTLKTVSKDLLKATWNFLQVSSLLGSFTKHKKLSFRTDISPQDSGQRLGNQARARRPQSRRDSPTRAHMAGVVQPQPTCPHAGQVRQHKFGPKHKGGSCFTMFASTSST